MGTRSLASIRRVHGWALPLVLTDLAGLIAAAFWCRGPELGAELGRLEQELPRAFKRPQ